MCRQIESCCVHDQYLAAIQQRMESSWDREFWSSLYEERAKLLCNKLIYIVASAALACCGMYFITRLDDPVKHIKEHHWPYATWGVCQFIFVAGIFITRCQIQQNTVKVHTTLAGHNQGLLLNFT